MSDTTTLPLVRPEVDDDRYDIRLKRRLAQDCVKMADAGMHEHALVALWEIGMSRKVDGTALPAVEERTRVQALGAFTRAMSLARDVPSESGEAEKHQHVHLHLAQPPATDAIPGYMEKMVDTIQRASRPEDTNGAP